MLDHAPDILRLRSEGVSRENISIRLHTSANTVRRVCEYFPVTRPPKVFRLQDAYDKTGVTQALLAERLVDRCPQRWRDARRTLTTWAHSGMTSADADLVAVTLGMMPDEIWPDWSDVVEAEDDEVVAYTAQAVEMAAAAAAAAAAKPIPKPPRPVWERPASFTGVDRILYLPGRESVDELVVSNVNVHIEQVDHKTYWIGIYGPDGQHMLTVDVTRLTKGPIRCVVEDDGVKPWPFERIDEHGA
jgi:hypothetical protein